MIANVIQVQHLIALWSVVVKNILDVGLKNTIHTHASGSHNSIGMEVSNSLTFIGNWVHNATTIG